MRTLASEVVGGVSFSLNAERRPPRGLRSYAIELASKEQSNGLTGSASMRAQMMAHLELVIILSVQIAFKMSEL